jgi:hypothetical protein
VKNLPTAGDLQTLLLSVTEEVMSKSDTVFSDLSNHMFDTEAFNNHRVQLVKNFAKQPIKIHLYIPLGKTVHIIIHWNKNKTRLN